jgi:hypothetical protein
MKIKMFATLDKAKKPSTKDIRGLVWRLSFVRLFKCLDYHCNMSHRHTNSTVTAKLPSNCHVNYKNFYGAVLNICPYWRYPGVIAISLLNLAGLHRSIQKQVDSLVASQHLLISTRKLGNSGHFPGSLQAKLHPCPRTDANALLEDFCFLNSFGRRELYPWIVLWSLDLIYGSKFHP